MIDVFDRLEIRAATIDELLSDDFEHLPGQKADAELAGRRLGMWCRSAASGDWTLFCKRLNRDCLSLEFVLARLGTVRVNAKRSTPQWLIDAPWIETALRDSPSRSSSNKSANDTALPFGDLFFALTEVAKQRRDEHLSSSALGRLSSAAYEGLSQLLVRDMSALCSRVIFERFRVFRDNNCASTEAIDQKYQLFINEMRIRGWSELLAERPVLLRLLSTLTRQWIDVTAEFLSRLDMDLEAAREHLLKKNVVSLVVQISAELSDRHNSGRSVYIVRFADSTAIVYKPRDLQVDARCSDLIDWLNARTPPVDLRVPRVLACEGYGWTEFIQYQGCADRQHVEMFFNRAGAWLAIFHIFAAVDMHEENIIAAGDYPIPIDLEMLLQPQVSGSDTDVDAMRSIGIATRTLSESVLATGLLPTLVRDPEAKVRRFGGLSDRQLQYNQIGWSHLNTDAMECLGKQTVNADAHNLPTFLEQKVSLGDYGDALVSGFNAYADFLSYQRHSILDEGLLSAFAGLPIRKVLRPTRVYFMLLSRLRDHRYMTDGVEWSAHLDFIARLSDWDQPTDALWPLCAAERKAMRELNVPSFRCPSDEDAVLDHTGVTVHSSERSGLARAQLRISTFDDREVALQKDVVRLSILTVTRAKDTGSLVKKMESNQLADVRANPLELPDRVSRIAQSISQWAIRDHTSAAWIGLASLGDSESCQLAALGFDLYNGSTGIALFLSAHAHVTGCQESRSLALSSLAPLRHVLHGAGRARFARTLGIGGASGLGSIVYALSVASKLLGDDDLLADAMCAASLLTVDVVDADRDLDVIDGASGAILGLLRLYRDCQASLALDRAVCCGEHLLKVGQPDSFVRDLWRTFGRRPLAGFSHGAAGFAYALSSLASATGRDDFGNAANNCLDYEQSLYSAERRNWPYLVSSDGRLEVSWPCQWCHGAAGIGLARLGMNRTEPSDKYTMDIEASIACVQESWPSSSDTLCCGNLGNIELLREAGRALDNQHLLDQAEQRLWSVCKTAELAGGYKLGMGGNRHNLGFFRGLAGVGYSLLRQVNAQHLPNVLIWE
jgi:type 2 lantibiotic biosynthesis protein LanM